MRGLTHSRESPRTLYRLSVEELDAWQRDFERQGLVRLTRCPDRRLADVQPLMGAGWRPALGRSLPMAARAIPVGTRKTTPSSAGPIDKPRLLCQAASQTRSGTWTAQHLSGCRWRDHRSDIRGVGFAGEPDHPLGEQIKRAIGRAADRASRTMPACPGGAILPTTRRAYDTAHPGQLRPRTFARLAGDGQVFLCLVLLGKPSCTEFARCDNSQRGNSVGLSNRPFPLGKDHRGGPSMVTALDLPTVTRVSDKAQATRDCSRCSTS